MRYVTPGALCLGLVCFASQEASSATSAGAPRPGAPPKAPISAVNVGGLPVAAPVIPIHILEPTHSSVWTIGEGHTISWTATDKVKYPLWLFLVSKDHKIPIVDIGKAGSARLPATAMRWLVPDNLYDQEYCIRITSADNTVQVHSQPFRIKATRTINFDVAPAHVANKVHTHNSNEIQPGPGDSYRAGLTPVPSPGGTIVKFGYQRWYRDGDNHGHVLHRSFVKFDLLRLLTEQQHKLTVKNCSFAWVTAPNSPQPACSSAMLCLDAAMPGGESMFGDAFAAFPKHLIGADPVVRVQMAQRWLDDPSKNYGVVVLAANEGQTAENGQCVRFVNLTLKLGIEEKLNK